MSKEIFVGNGASWVIKGKGKGSVWGLDGFDPLFNPKGAKKTCQSGIIIQDVQPKYGDISVPVAGVDDVRVLYTFGQQFGQISVKGLILMGSTDKKSEDYASELLQKFNKVRLSSDPIPYTVSGPGLGTNTRVYWTGLSFPSSDADKNTMTFILTGLIAPISNKG